MEIKILPCNVFIVNIVFRENSSLALFRSSVDPKSWLEQNSKDLKIVSKKKNGGKSHSKCGGS